MAVYSLYRSNMKRSAGARPKYSQTLHTMAIINCAIFISSLYTPHYSKWIKSLPFKVKQSFILWTARDINTTCDIFLRLLRICHRTEKMAPLFNNSKSCRFCVFTIYRRYMAEILPSVKRYPINPVLLFLDHSLPCKEISYTNQNWYSKNISKFAYKRLYQIVRDNKTTIYCSVACGILY